MGYQILALGGDGIGPKVLASGIRVAESAASQFGVKLNIKHGLLGGSSWDQLGTFCSDKLLEEAKQATALLVGAVGGPKWDNIEIEGPPEIQDGLMRLRKELKTFFGIRPAYFYENLNSLVPFKRKIVNGTDILVLREMCGGVMFGRPRGSKNENGNRLAFDTTIYNEFEIKRFVEASFEMALLRKRNIVSADKANVMESYKLWRQIVDEVSTNYPSVKVTHMYADNCLFQMCMKPSQFDVVIGCNFIGDLISDLAGAVTGSLGMLPSACLSGPPGKNVHGIYEPVHGSAPDLEDTTKANPIGMILSVAMMFDYSFGRIDIRNKIEKAVSNIIKAGLRTPDIGGSDSTDMITKGVINEIEK